MPRKSDNPRYNILSCRVSNDMKQSIKHAVGRKSVQDFLHSAIEEKLINDRQARIDDVIRGLK